MTTCPRCDARPCQCGPGLDCTECGGASPRSHEWCEHCDSKGTEPCFYKFAGCTHTATRMVDRHPSCSSCDLSEATQDDRDVANIAAICAGARAESVEFAKRRAS